MERGIYVGNGFDLSYVVYQGDGGKWFAQSFQTGIHHEITNEKNFLSNHRMIMY